MNDERAAELIEAIKGLSAAVTEQTELISGQLEVIRMVLDERLGTVADELFEISEKFPKESA